MKALAITGVNVRRLVRDPSTIFFVFIFPMLLILVLGASFGGGFEPKVAVAAMISGRLPRSWSTRWWGTRTSRVWFTTIGTCCWRTSNGA